MCPDIKMCTKCVSSVCNMIRLYFNMLKKFRLGCRLCNGIIYNDEAFQRMCFYWDK